MRVTQPVGALPGDLPRRLYRGDEALESGVLGGRDGPGVARAVERSAAADPPLLLVPDALLVRVRARVGARARARVRVRVRVRVRNGVGVGVGAGPSGRR